MSLWLVLYECPCMSPSLVSTWNLAHSSYQVASRGILSNEPEFWWVEPWVAWTSWMFLSLCSCSCRSFGWALVGHRWVLVQIRVPSRNSSRWCLEPRGEHAWGSWTRYTKWWACLYQWSQVSGCQPGLGEVQWDDAGGPAPIHCGPVWPRICKYGWCGEIHRFAMPELTRQTSFGCDDYIGWEVVCCSSRCQLAASPPFWSTCRR